MALAARPLAATLVAAISLVWLGCEVQAAISGGTITGGRVGPAPDPVFVQTTPMWTTEAELDARPAGSDSIATNLASVAAGEQLGGFPETITAGEWETDTSRCEPLGETTDGEVMEQAARAIYGLALDFVVNGDTDSASTARTQILNIAATTQFGNDEAYSGRQNECSLTLGEAVPAIVNAALLLEDGGYVSWTSSDRDTLATWLAEEAFPPMTHAATTSKNNWGIAALGGAYAAARYVQGGYTSNLLDYAGTPYTAAGFTGTTVFSWLSDWLSTVDDLGDNGSGTCSFEVADVYGQQTSGSFPDDVRRTGTIADCSAADLSVSCTVGASPFDLETDCDDGIFYMQKSASNLVRLAEMVRRVEGDGADVYDLSTHGGANQNIYDALLFGTTASGGTAFQDYRVETAFISGYNVAGAYYQNDCMVDALRATDVTYFNRGGLDFPWTALTHYPGVAASVPSPCSGDPYDLSSFSINFTHTWPTPPSSLTTRTVTDCASVATAVSTANSYVDARSVETDCSGTTLNFNANNVHLVMDSVNDFAMSSITGDVIHIEGGSLTNSGSVDVIVNGDDLLIDNVLMTASVGSFLFDGYRQAVINSSINADRNAIGGGYGSETVYTDHTFANVYARGTGTTQPAWRLQRHDRLVIVDTCSQPNANNALRIHGSRDVHVENFINDSTLTSAAVWLDTELFTGTDNPRSIDNVQFLNIDCYRSGGDQCVNLRGSSQTNVNVGGGTYFGGTPYLRLQANANDGTAPSPTQTPSNSTASFVSPDCSAIGADH